MGGVPPRYPPHPISIIPTLHIHAHPLWPTWPPPRLCAHLHTLPHTSVHLCAPCVPLFPGFFLHPLHFLCPGTLPSLSHGPWVGKFFLLGKTLVVVPRGLQGLGPKGGIGVLGYIQPTTFSTSAPIHHHGDTFHFHLLVCAAWGSIPTSQGSVPVQGSILTNLGFHPHLRFHPHHLWSMTTLSLPPGGLLVGVVSMRGKGHWLGVGGSVRVYRSS